MDKIWKRFGILLFAALFLACSINLPVKAQEVDLTDDVQSSGGEYTYMVRIFAGKQGTIGGSEVKEYPGVELNGSVVFSIDEVKLSNDKYFVKGIRESGKDNSEVINLRNNTISGVDCDIDYVVAYGLRGNMVPYTVRFVDAETGERLADDETYYGNVGDKPVVSYLYIEGYQPRSYNMTGTLQANPDNDPEINVFTFRYISLDGAPSVENETVTVVTRTDGTDTSTTEVVPATGGGAGTNAGANAGAGVAAGDNAGAAAGGGAATGGGAAGGGAADGGAAADGAADDGVVIAEPEVPLDTIDLDTMDEDGVYLDDPSVPLADMKFQIGPIEMDARRLAVTLAVLTAVATIAIASFLYWRPRRKKEETDEKDAARSV